MTSTQQTAPVAAPMTEAQAKNLRRSVFSSVIGATIEWYDFFLYGVVAGIVFNKVFFPTEDPVVGTLLAYGSFALGFVARPLGGIIFGHFGDRLGRKTMMVLTLNIMGAATVAIGLIPDFDTIGILAPLLLLVCRFAQGVGLGGEWGGGVLISYESAPPERRAFYASLPQMGMSIGLMLASGVVAALSFVMEDTAFMAWGWRIAFLLSAIMVVLGAYIRMNVNETEDFETAKRIDRSGERKPAIPLVELLRGSLVIVLFCMGARLIDGVFFNVFGVYSLNYLTQEISISRTVALTGVMIGAVAMTVTIPLWGRAADRIGSARVFAVGSILAGLSAFPAFWLIVTYPENVWLVWLAIAAPFGLFHGAYFATMSSLFAGAFEARIRYTGISFVYQVAGIFAGGMTPIIATMLTSANGGDPWYMCTYVLVIGLISAYCARWIGLNASVARISLSGSPMFEGVSRPPEPRI